MDGVFWRAQRGGFCAIAGGVCPRGGLGGGNCVVGGGVGLAHSKRIVRPIDALHHAAIAVANGRWQTRVQPDGGAQELHAVATQFNRMLDHRDAVQAVLQDSQARLKILADLSSDWYWEQDAEHRTTRVYGRVAEGTGLPETSYLGKTRWDLNALNMDAVQWAAHRAVLDAHQPFRDLEIERLDAQGQRW